jgi:hypothetical protein
VRQPETAEAVLENADVERHEQADRDRGQFQVGDHLRQMDGLQVVDRLELDEDGVFDDDDVKAIAAVPNLMAPFLRALHAERGNRETSRPSQKSRK